MIDAKDIRMVKMHKGNNLHVETLFLHVNDVETFIEAQEKLHYLPGYNPYSKLVCARLTYLEVSELDPNHDQACWWCYPSLDQRVGPGAKVLGWKMVLQKHYPDPELKSPEVYNYVDASDVDTAMCLGG